MGYYIKKRFMRDCKKCGISFRPTGKYTELCDKCWEKKRSARGGIRVEKRLHNVWKEREEARANGIKIRRLVGKWQYIYRSKNREVSLIRVVPGMSGNMVWEVMRLKPKDKDGPYQFGSRILAYEKVRELLL